MIQSRALPFHQRNYMPLIAVCVVALIFWTGVSVFTGGREPWDHASYLTIIYPAALALSAVVGSMLQRAQWAAGTIVMFAQIPVMLVTAEASALLAVGILYAALLSIPAMALAWLAGRWRQARRRQ